MLWALSADETRPLTTPSAADKEYVEHCLEATGLIDLRNRQIDTLSGRPTATGFPCKDIGTAASDYSA